jgi:uncharacterized protein (TIGR02271 family)
MTDADVVTVVDYDGVRATTRLHEPVTGLANHVLLQLEDGRTFVVSRDLLEVQADGTYLLPMTFRSLRETNVPVMGHTESSTDANIQGDIVIPVIEEDIEIAKQGVKRRRLRIAKSVHEREVIIDQPLTQEHVDVNRVVVNRMVDEPPQVRYEGDTIIMPVLEEVVVVDIRLMLREEVHITRRRVETHEPQHVTLRREEVIVEPIETSEPVDDIPAATKFQMDSR